MFRHWLVAVLLIVGVGAAHSADIACVLQHSAVAELTHSDSVDVHTTDDDSIAVRLSGLGSDTALSNDTHTLVRIGSDTHAIFYRQEDAPGLVIWAYFPKSHAITYAKLRTYPANGLPSSYLMISRYTER